MKREWRAVRLGSEVSYVREDRASSAGQVMKGKSYL